MYLLAYVNNGTGKKIVKLSSLNEEGEESEEEENEDTEENKYNETQQPSNVLNPTFIFTLLSQLYEIYTEYCSNLLKASKVEENYDIFSNVTQDFLQSGYPFITDVNILKDITPNRESLGSKIINTTNSIAKSYGSGSSNLSLSSLTSQVSGSHGKVRTISSSASGSKFRGISSQSLDAVPWRKPGIKYTNNELFLDITETLNVVMTPSSHTNSMKKRSSHSNKSQISISRSGRNNTSLQPRYATITGQVDFRSTLSGIPQVQLIFNLNDHSLGLPALHHSINKQKFQEMNGKLLSFIPPDGHFRLMDYVLDIDTYPASNSIRKYMGVVEIEYEENLGLRHNEFEIRLNLKINSKVQSVQGLRVGIRSSHSSEQENDISIKVLRISHGDFQIKKGHDKYEWVFDDEVKLGVNPILRCAIESEDTAVPNNKTSLPTNIEVERLITKVAFPKEISLNYSNKGALASGIKVDSLNILKGVNDTVKPFKGVKYSTKTGDFVIR